MYTQFSGMNFGVHECGTGGEPFQLEGTIMDVLVMGGSFSSSGNSCVDVYPSLCDVSDGYGGTQLDEWNPS